MNTGDLFTWAALATMGGASMLTYFVVMYTKEIIARWLPGLPTTLYAVGVAAIILTLAQLALGAYPWDWRIYVLALANGFLVAATAGHMSDKALKPPGGNKNANQ